MLTAQQSLDAFDKLVAVTVRVDADLLQLLVAHISQHVQSDLRDEATVDQTQKSDCSTRYYAEHPARNYTRNNMAGWGLNGVMQKTPLSQIPLVIYMKIPPTHPDEDLLLTDAAGRSRAR